MALKKTIPLPFQADLVANYIRIDHVAYNRREGVLEIGLSYYMDQDSAIGERPPVGADVVRLSGDDAALWLASIHDLAGPTLYEIVKSRDLYEDAEDLP